MFSTLTSFERKREKAKSRYFFHPLEHENLMWRCYSSPSPPLFPFSPEKKIRKRRRKKKEEASFWLLRFTSRRLEDDRRRTTNDERRTTNDEDEDRSLTNPTPLQPHHLLVLFVCVAFFGVHSVKNKSLQFFFFFFFIIFFLLFFWRETRR